MWTSWSLVTSASSTAATNTAVSSVPQDSHEVDSLPLEFLNLSEVDLKSIDDSSPGFKESFVLMGVNQERMDNDSHQINFANPSGNRSKLRECYHRVVEAHPTTGKSIHQLRAILRNKLSEAYHEPRSQEISPVVCHDETIMLASSCSRGTKGVLDTGATKTVVGSHNVKELIDHFDPSIRSQLKRCKCNITFRFGNQGTLDATTSLIVPLGSLLLQIAVVPGGTPFLVSNSLLRALKCNVDLDRCEIRSPLLKQAIPIELSNKGLFLVDINHIAMNARIFPKEIQTFHVDDQVRSETPPASPSTDEFEKYGDGGKPIDSEKQPIDSEKQPIDSEKSPIDEVKIQSENGKAIHDDTKQLRFKTSSDTHPVICPAIARRHVQSRSSSSSTTGAGCSNTSHTS